MLLTRRKLSSSTSACDQPGHQGQHTCVIQVCVQEGHTLKPRPHTCQPHSDLHRHRRQPLVQQACGEDNFAIHQHLRLSCAAPAKHKQAAIYDTRAHVAQSYHLLLWQYELGTLQMVFDQAAGQHKVLQQACRQTYCSRMACSCSLLLVISENSIPTSASVS